MALRIRWGQTFGAFWAKRVASVDGFGYSSALTAYSEGGTQWQFENMNAFLLKPRHILRAQRWALWVLKKMKTVPILLLI